MNKLFWQKMEPLEYLRNSSKFRNYDVNDGLQSNEFNTGAFYLGKNGEIFFGGIKGLNYFYNLDLSDYMHSGYFKLLLDRRKWLF